MRCNIESILFRYLSVGLFFFGRCRRSYGIRLSKKNSHCLYLHLKKKPFLQRIFNFQKWSLCLIVYMCSNEWNSFVIWCKVIQKEKTCGCIFLVILYLKYIINIILLMSDVQSCYVAMEKVVLYYILLLTDFKFNFFLHIAMINQIILTYHFNKSTFVNKSWISCIFAIP
mgnify:CR=1 FL=1